jgi:hypothetical protein
MGRLILVSGFCAVFSIREVEKNHVEMHKICGFSP